MKTLFFVSLFIPHVLAATDCDSQWKANSHSSPGTRRWNVTSKIAGLDVDMEIVEGSRVINPTTLETWSVSKVSKSFIPIPEQKTRNTLTKALFCELLSGKKELPLDLRSPGVLISQMQNEKPLRTEKIVVPAGAFSANVYEKQMGKKGTADAIFLTVWIAKVGNRHLGIKFKALAGQGVSATNTAGNLASYKF